MDFLSRWSLRHARLLSRMYQGFEASAPRIAPLLRWLPADRLDRLVRPVEQTVKRAFFDCQMCGQCGLSVTGMACPMGCAKGMRNGPCGGVRADGHCEVHPQRRCTWVDAAQGDRRIRTGHTATWWQRAEPRDHRLAGRSTWTPMLAPTPRARLPLAAPPAPVSRASRDTPPSGAFEARCRQRSEFIVTVEISPPDSPDPASLLRRAAVFDGLVDAINITDGAGANCHMSSVAASAVLTAAGYTTVAQISCRDRNRIAVQGDVLGAAALGARNFLCLTGDDVSQGDHPQAKPVFDLDAVNLLHILAGMRDRGEYASGRKLEQAPRFMLGATTNPFVPPFAERIANLQRKIDSGAQFIQTQFCFDIERLRSFMREVCSRGLHERAAIIVGVGVLSTAKALHWMADHVPGVHVPAAVTERIAAAADQRSEGRRYCVEMIRQIRSVEGVSGVHLMGYRNEDVLARIIVEAGLRRSPSPELQAV